MQVGSILCTLCLSSESHQDRHRTVSCLGPQWRVASCNQCVILQASCMELMQIDLHDLMMRLLVADSSS